MGVLLLVYLVLIKTDLCQNSWAYIRDDNLKNTLCERSLNVLQRKPNV